MYICKGLLSLFVGNVLAIMDMDYAIYQNVRLFVLAAATTITAVFVLGLKIPDVKCVRLLSSSRMMMAFAFFFLGAPIFLDYFFSSIPKAMLYIAFSLDTIAYYLLIAAVFQVVSGKSLVKTGRLFMPCLLVAALASALCFMSYLGITGNFVRFLAIALFAVSSVCMCVAFHKAGSPVSKWFSVEFYATLFMTVYSGIFLPFGLLDGALSDVILILYTLMNILYVVSFANYLSGLRTRGAAPAKSRQKEKDLKERLDRWVEDEKYLLQDQGMDEVAAGFGVDLEYLRYYFRTYMPSDFRTWRVSLRIGYARKRIEETPDISMNELAGLAGFVSKSNFYYFFKKITGITPSEYRQNVMPAKAKSEE